MTIMIARLSLALSIMLAGTHEFAAAQTAKPASPKAKEELPKAEVESIEKQISTILTTHYDGAKKIEPRYPADEDEGLKWNLTLTRIRKSMGLPLGTILDIAVKPDGTFELLGTVHRDRQSGHWFSTTYPVKKKHPNLYKSLNTNSKDGPFTHFILATGQITVSPAASFQATIRPNELTTFRTILSEFDLLTRLLNFQYGGDLLDRLSWSWRYETNPTALYVNHSRSLVGEYKLVEDALRLVEAYGEEKHKILADRQLIQDTLCVARTGYLGKVKFHEGGRFSRGEFSAAPITLTEVTEAQKAIDEARAEFAKLSVFQRTVIVVGSGWIPVQYDPADRNGDRTNLRKTLREFPERGQLDVRPSYAVGQAERSRAIADRLKVIRDRGFSFCREGVEEAVKPAGNLIWIGRNSEAEAAILRYAIAVSTGKVDAEVQREANKILKALGLAGEATVSHQKRLNYVVISVNGKKGELLVKVEVEMFGEYFRKCQVLSVAKGVRLPSPEQVWFNLLETVGTAEWKGEGLLLHLEGGGYDSMSSHSLFSWPSDPEMVLHSHVKRMGYVLRSVKGSTSVTGPGPKPGQNLVVSLYTGYSNYNFWGPDFVRDWPQVCEDLRISHYVVHPNLNQLCVPRGCVPEDVFTSGFRRFLTKSPPRSSKLTFGDVMRINLEDPFQDYRGAAYIDFTSIFKVGPLDKKTGQRKIISVQ